MHGKVQTLAQLTNAQGQPVWQWAYSAFGDNEPTIAKYRFANQSTTPNPGTTNIAAIEFNKRWDGQYHDKESGLRYNLMRSYWPSGGVFSQPDPIGLAGGPNRRVIDENNPLLYTDPSGLINHEAQRQLDKWFSAVAGRMG
jgi:RHS repeat-associated protein